MATVERDDWNGVLTGVRKSEPDLVLQAPIRQSNQGGSGAFLGLASDGNRYWIKTLNNRQHPRVPANEQIVARAASLIDAPACEVRSIALPSDFSTWEFRPGHKLEAGIAHASRAIENAVPTHRLEHRKEDKNGERHTYICALYDWCWGNDPQWLMDLSDEHRFYSHDHGHYLPGGPGWTAQSLGAHVDQAHTYNDKNVTLDKTAANTCADRLRTLTRQDLVEVLSSIPADWAGVSDAELECLGFFLERRLQPVADRLVARAGETT